MHKRRVVVEAQEREIEGLKAEVKKWRRAFFEAVDSLAIDARGGEDNVENRELIEQLGELVGLKICVRCRDWTHRPSEYLNEESEMSHLKDMRLKGNLCEDCAGGMERV